MKYFVFLFLATLTLGGYYFVVLMPSFPEKTYFYIKKGSDFGSMVNQLKEQGFVHDAASFRLLAEYYGFDKDSVKSGKFLISGGLGNRALIEAIRLANSVPDTLALHDFRTKEEVAGWLGRKLEPDSIEFITYFNDTAVIERDGFTPENLMAAFIPNTYYVNWTITPKDFTQRMFREHRRFWNEERMKKAKAKALTTKQAYILASILEKETLQNSEKERMAGVYLNRLKTKGWKLDANPTTLFALKDFTIKTLTQEHKDFDSPYNTYKYEGLPPGPICMASIPSIDAVLNAEKHDYWFFVAKGDDSGLHNFSKDLKKHKNNVTTYKKNKQP